VPLLRARMTADDLLEVEGLQPELPQRPRVILDDDIEAPDDDRVRARISDAIRSRVRPNPIAGPIRRPRATRNRSTDFTCPRPCGWNRL
jgi:hypothetical protein